MEDDHPGIHQTGRKMNLATANGVITANERVHTEVGALGMPINPILLTNTVNVVSVGRMVIDGGWSFHWTNDGAAYFENADREKFFCDIQGYVPVIEDAHTTCRAMPGVDDPSGADAEVEQEPQDHAADDPAEAESDRDEHRDDEGGDEMSRDEKLKKEANTPEHCLTHRRKNPFCWVCAMVKMTAKPARRIDPSARSTDPTAFGQHVGADHVTGLDRDKTSINDQQVGMYVLDYYTMWPRFYSTKSKSAVEATRAMNDFLGSMTMDTLHSDNSKDLELVGKELARLHNTCTPDRPQSNSIVERGIRTMLEGARCALLQAGLPPRFWPLACSHHTFATAISPQLNDQPSPYWLKYGEEFTGWRLPFGALVHYRPPKPVLKRQHKMDPRTIPGIFVDWHLDPGCAWKGDYLIIPLSAFRIPGRKYFHAHRVKEMVSFDPMSFPLQAAYLEERIKVNPPEIRGENVWAGEVERTTDEEVNENSATLDQRVAEEIFGEDDIEGSKDASENVDERAPAIKAYHELFGRDPTDDLEVDEIYSEIIHNLFGHEGQGDERKHVNDHDEGADETSTMHVPDGTGARGLVGRRMSRRTIQGRRTEGVGTRGFRETRGSSYPSVPYPRAPLRYRRRGPVTRMQRAMSSTAALQGRLINKGVQSLGVRSSASRTGG